jgi:hypothetical protein
MSEVMPTPPKPKPIQSAPADAKAFAQAEKWMAVIREIGREEAKKINRS